MTHGLVPTIKSSVCPPSSLLTITSTTETETKIETETKTITTVRHPRAIAPGYLSMGNHHEPFMALGPISWDDVPLNSLKLFSDGILADAQTIIESIPMPETLPAAAAAAAAAAPGRGRSKTDPAAQLADASRAAPHPQTLSPDAAAIVEQLRPEWKQVKTNAKDNPMGISVFKLASKDGKGAWFARRSIHDHLGFDKWRSGLEREFSETIKVQSGPGSGGIRGIGADKRVEDRPVEDVGSLSVFQLSARFPGPTAPRDFVTLLLTSESSRQHVGRSRPLRQYMVVSKPCVHPECPSQQGIIRGQYESVELVREVPMGLDRLPGKASPSLPTTDPDGNERRRSAIDYGQDQPTVIEWLMITRSDPGGSVPRFMVEKGTPPGIIGDAGKFVKWINSRSTDSLLPATGASIGNRTEAETEDGTGSSSTTTNFKLRIHSSPEDGDGGSSGGGGRHEAEYGDEQLLSTSGIYGIITGIYGVASSVVASGLRQFSSPAGSNASQESIPGTEEPDDDEAGEDDNDHDNDDEDEEEEDDDDDDNRTASSEASSIGTFASALERGLADEQRQAAQGQKRADASSPAGANGPLEKELRKLQERRRKLDEKAAQMHELLEQKRRGSKEKDDATVAKLRDKHDRELAKQEAKYRREMQKLEEKRELEARKAEARRHKAADKEEKLALTLELERARVERDVALKQLEILKGQVGELQAQNTLLVARMGKMIGLDVADSSGSKASSIGVGGSPKAA